MWLILALLSLTGVLSFLGWRWDSRRQRPALAKRPLVSVIIPSYKSPYLADAVASAKALDYANKEIIVVDDSPGPTPHFPGVTVIKNPVRMGKSAAMNLAVKKSKGEILYFIDSDTVTAPDALNKIVPWFTPDVAAVSPKFTVRNKSNVLTRMIALEHYFIASLFRIHMYFGSLISFRGCGIAIRRSALDEVGGWRATMIEDTDLAATLLEHGYKILYEPDAIVETVEPSSWSDFKKQRQRWGVGTGFSFGHHWRLYAKSPQFMVYIFPYAMLFLGVMGFLFYQTTIFLLPAASLYLITTLSIRELVGISALILIPNIASILTSTTAAGFAHIALLTRADRKDLRDLGMILPYMFLYFPFTFYCYAKGVILSISDYRHKRGETNFSHWKI